MLDPLSLLNIFKENKISFFSGVPDSLLKEFNQALLHEIPEDDHLITVNEGTAISFGIGYHLATSKTPLIYMQNSGLGNAINPLTSLATLGLTPTVRCREALSSPIPSRNP